jgi:hypothetical protein
MGTRNKSAGRRGAAKRKDSRQQEFPPDVESLINGRIVDLSNVHKKYGQLWDAVRPRLRALVVDRRQGKYELDSSFFELFLESLRELMKPFGSNRRNAPDLIALALFNAGFEYGTPESPVREPIVLWPGERPVSEAWQMFGEPRALATRDVVLEDPGPGHELQTPSSSDYEFPRIHLRIRVNGDPSALPKITIELEGELACVLMKGMYWSSDPDDLRARRNDAKRIWNALFGKLAVMVGIRQPYEGRPIDPRMEGAAHLKYMYGLTWRQVAAQLCSEKHEVHTKVCQERFRNGVKALWKRLLDNARQLPPVTG